MDLMGWLEASGTPEPWGFQALPTRPGSTLMAVVIQYPNEDLRNRAKTCIPHAFYGYRITVRDQRPPAAAKAVPVQPVPKVAVAPKAAAAAAAEPVGAPVVGVVPVPAPEVVPPPPWRQAPVVAAPLDGQDEAEADVVDDVGPWARRRMHQAFRDHLQEPVVEDDYGVFPEEPALPEDPQPPQEAVPGNSSSDTEASSTLDAGLLEAEAADTEEPLPPNRDDTPTVSSPASVASDPKVEHVPDWVEDESFLLRRAAVELLVLLSNLFCCWFLLVVLTLNSKP